MALVSLCGACDRAPVPVKAPEPRHDPTAQYELDMQRALAESAATPDAPPPAVAFAGVYDAGDVWRHMAAIDQPVRREVVWRERFLDQPVTGFGTVTSIDLDPGGASRGDAVKLDVDLADGRGHARLHYHDADLADFAGIDREDIVMFEGTMIACDSYLGVQGDTLTELKSEAPEPVPSDVLHPHEDVQSPVLP